MRQIVIFENEYDILREAFELANLVYFNNEFVFKVFETSQDFGQIDAVKDYEKILVDIDLSSKSEKDGYTLIRDINMLEEHPSIIILTGHSHIEAKLKELDISVQRVLKKPLNVQELASCLSQ